MKNCGKPNKTSPIEVVYWVCRPIWDDVKCKVTPKCLVAGMVSCWVSHNTRSNSWVLTMALRAFEFWTIGPNCPNLWGSPRSTQTNPTLPQSIAFAQKAVVPWVIIGRAPHSRGRKPVKDYEKNLEQTRINQKILQQHLSWCCIIQNIQIPKNLEIGSAMAMIGDVWGPMAGKSSTSWSDHSWSFQHSMNQYQRRIEWNREWHSKYVKIHKWVRKTKNKSIKIIARSN